MILQGKTCGQKKTDRGILIISYHRNGFAIKGGLSETTTKTGFGVLEIWQQSPLRLIEAKAIQPTILNITIMQKHFVSYRRLNLSNQTLQIIMKTASDLLSLHMNDTA